jgi:hypothetical protein
MHVTRIGITILSLKFRVMNKSVIIIVSAVWILCAMYVTLGRVYSFPYLQYAMIGSWIASLLLLVCIVIFIKKHKSK